MSSLDSYRAPRKMSLKGVREKKLRSPEARLKKQSVPASHLVRGSSLPSVGQHPSQVTRTPRLLCGMQQASSWSLQLPLGLGRPESFGLTVEKGLPAAMPAQTERLSCLEHQRSRADYRNGDQRLPKLLAVRSGAVPEPGGLAPAADTHLGCLRETVHGIYG